MKKTQWLAAPTLLPVLLSACAKPATEEGGQNQTPLPTDPGQVQTQEQTQGAEPVTERLYYDTKGADYGGYSFGIWNFDNVIATGWVGIPFDLFVDELNGDVLNDAINIFRENRSLFMIRPLQSLFVMREMEADFGIIPLPKYDAAQDGCHSAVNPYSGTICMIPRTAEDAERSGVVLSALACESHYTVINRLYETVLGEKLIRDRDSAVMLDYAFDGTLFDPGVIRNFGGIRDTLLSQKGTDVSSMLSRVSKVVNKSIEKFNKELEETD